MAVARLHHRGVGLVLAVAAAKAGEPLMQRGHHRRFAVAQRLPVQRASIARQDLEGDVQRALLEELLEPTDMSAKRGDRGEAVARQLSLEPRAELLGGGAAEAEPL